MSDIEWLEPWFSVEEQESRRGTENELAREICEKHVLHGQKVTLIARSGASDDALFLLPDGRVAEVHLTWSGKRESDPAWPVTGIFPSLSVWAAECMVPQHRIWADDD